MDFPCKKCGACCRRVWMLGEEALLENGIMINKDGSCTNLKEDNSCGIYEKRPEICKINSMVKEGDLKQYYIETAEACNQWMEEDGINDKIDINEIV